MEDFVKVFKKIKAIEFGFISPKNIQEMSVAKIVTPELYDKEAYPVDGGLMDIRLGVIDPGLTCRTCGNKFKECPGHFGYIELARPVLHIEGIALIFNLLKTTCHNCGRVLLSDEKIELVKERLAETERIKGHENKIKEIRALLAKLKSISKCPHCSAKQKVLKLDKPYTFIEAEAKLSPIQIRARLERIPDKDLEIFAINTHNMRPEWLILTKMLIPPVTMRTSLTLESGERAEDDLTHKLADIVKINQRLFENINAGAPEIIIDEFWELLQYHVTTFFNNDISGIPPARHRTGQPLRTLSDRIKGKEGRIRNNLAGKRTNFCARSVISPDPMIEIDEVGIPYSVARKLTIPEKVTAFNTEFLKELVNKGKKAYPGANFVVRPDGLKKTITDETKEQILEELQPGYTVQRHLMNGDVCIFNRQPTLHRMSIMCHKIKVIPGKTFRVNPAVCFPYAGDFDGDEMNLHIPQTEESRAEAELIMNVQKQLVSPCHGLTVVGCAQDSVAGMYILTKNTQMSRSEAIKFLYSIGHKDFSRLPNKETVDGKDLVTALLPEGFTFYGKSKSGPVAIENGVLKEGVLDATLLSKGSGLLLRNLLQKEGEKFTTAFIGKMFRLGIRVLIKEGITFNISDIDTESSFIDEIGEVFKDADKKIKKVQDELYKNETISKQQRAMAEDKILELLGEAQNGGMKKVTDYFNKKTSSTTTMIDSGAKGSTTNLASMSAFVGQQNSRGGRIRVGFRNRTLSCFKHNDIGSDQGGFIKSSYKHGLSPHEFFFRSITSRDAYMDIALRTPKSGYLYRRLANALADLKVEFDNTIRDVDGKIIQYEYGEDGIDVSKSEKGRIDIQKIIREVVGN